MSISKKRLKYSLTGIFISSLYSLIVASSSNQNAAFLAFCFFLVTVFCSARYHSIVSGSTVFLILLGVFHLGMVVPIVVYDTPYPYLNRPWLDWATIPHALSLYTLGVGSFLAGTFQIIKKQKFISDESRKVKPDNFIVKFWMSLYILSIFGYLFYGYSSGILTSPDRYLYLELQQAGDSVWFGFFQEIIVIANMGVIAFTGKRSAVIVTCLTIIIFTPLFLLGQRGSFIVTLSSLVVILKMSGVVLPRILYFGGAAFLLFLVPIIRNMRGGVQAFADGFLDPLYEMGQTLRVVLFSIDAVETDVWGFQYGKTYLQAFGRIIPNIGGIRSFVGGMREDSPGYIITELYNPGGAGLGMSGIAEAYINFGTLGVLIVFFILGIAIAYGEKKGRLNPYIQVIYGSTAGSIFWLARADLYAVTRPFAWSLIIVLFTYILKNSKFGK